MFIKRMSTTKFIVVDKEGFIVSSFNNFKDALDYIRSIK